MVQRQVNPKGGALASSAFCSNETAMVLGSFAYNGQPDTGAPEFCIAMQSLEDLEDLFSVFLVEANAIVGDTDLVIIDHLFFGR